jgi:enoyl-CoA hydratase/carnithine racemase
VLLIGLNRPEKRNAFNLAVIEQLAAAYYELGHDEDIRCGVLFGHGDHFTGGLDLTEVGPLVREGRLDELFSAPGRRDPWRKDNIWTTPVVAAVQGRVMTLAIELERIGADGWLLPGRHAGTHITAETLRGR